MAAPCCVASSMTGLHGLGAEYRAGAETQGSADSIVDLVPTFGLELDVGVALNFGLSPNTLN